MARVKCTIPNACDTINNIHFEFIDGAWVSDVISQDEANFFCLIPGYTQLEGDNIDVEIKAVSLIDVELPDATFTHTKPKGRPKKSV